MRPLGPAPQEDAVPGATPFLATVDAGLDLTVPPDAVDAVVVEITAGPEAARAARAAVRDFITDHAAVATQEAAELLVSELVTNSVRHGELDDGDVVRLGLRVEDGIARLEVDNAGTAGAVVARPPMPEAGGGGYGLMLLDALAHRWGVERANARTQVWLELVCRPA